MHLIFQRTAPAAWVALLVLSGCVLTRPPAPATETEAPIPELRTAETLFQQERYAEALVACIELQRQNDLTPGLAELQARIMTRLAEERRQTLQQRERHGTQRMHQDITRHTIVPETYQLRRGVVGETSPLRTPPSSMQAVLDRPVSVHLNEVNLQEFIAQIGEAENVNIVADSDLTTSTLSIRADNTPLREILEFVSRNLGVSFSVGENLIWATAAQPQPGEPMDTRIYRLRKGLSGEEIEGGPDSIGIIAAIRRFVPDLPGSDILFNAKGHVLIAKHTRPHLAMMEDIIQALDIHPPQVLIEARFISANVNDLRELGVDWILGSPIVTTKKTEGPHRGQTRTRINPADPLIAFTPMDGAARGLNLVYEGVLTDPMFKAVVHALETSGKSRTLSVPRVTTVNNRPALIRIGEDFRFYEEFEVIDIPAERRDGVEFRNAQMMPRGTPKLEELGIELQVTPSVGADSATINLMLTPEISEFVRWEYYETAGDAGGTLNHTNGAQRSMLKLPIFRRSRIETEVVTRSGETVVMGGLISSTEQRVHEAVPVLSAIPFLGRLFRSERTEKMQNNLIIFVTATLISDVGEELIPLTPLSDPSEPYYLAPHP